MEVRKYDKALEWTESLLIACLVRTVTLVLGWSMLAFLAYQTTTLETEAIAFDPYEILEVDRVSNRLQPLTRPLLPFMFCCVAVG